jgi:hypothetical protein
MIRRRMTPMGARVPVHMSVPVPVMVVVVIRRREFIRSGTSFVAFTESNIADLLSARQEEIR